MARIIICMCACVALFAVSQEEQNEIWRKALEDSKRQAEQRGGQAPPPASRPPTPEEDRAAREREADQLRAEQNRLKLEREARERETAEAQRRIDAQREKQWRDELRRQEEDNQRRKEALVAAEQERQVEAERERQRAASVERTNAVLAVGIGILAILVLCLPSLIAAIRGSEQRPAIAGLVLCSILSGGIALAYPVAASGPLIIWAAALTLSLWRTRQT